MSWRERWLPTKGLNERRLSQSQENGLAELARKVLMPALQAPQEQSQIMAYYLAVAEYVSYFAQDTTGWNVNLQPFPAERELAVVTFTYDPKNKELPFQAIAGSYTFGGRGVSEHALFRIEAKPILSNSAVLTSNGFIPLSIAAHLNKPDNIFDAPQVNTHEEVEQIAVQVAEVFAGGFIGVMIDTQREVELFAAISSYVASHPLTGNKKE